MKPTKESLTLKEFLSLSKWVVKILWKIDPKGTVISIIVDVIGRLDNLASTWLLGLIFDQIVKAIERGETNLNFLTPYLIGLLIYNIFSYTLYYIQGVNSNEISLKVSTEVDRLLYNKMHELGLDILESPSMNNTITRANRSLGRITGFFRQLTDLIATLVSIIATTVAIFTFAPYLIPLIIIGAIPGILNDKKYRTLMWKHESDTTEENRKANSTAGMLRMLPNLQEIFINKALNYLDKKYKDFIDKDIEKRMYLNKKWTGGNNFWNLIGEIFIYIGYIDIFKNAILKKITIGDVYFQTRMLQRLSGDFGRLVYTYTNIFEVAIRMNDAYELFQMEPKKKENAKKMQKLEEGPDIQFNNVVFSYPETNKKIINKLNLKIKSGEKIALVGINGAGKTTLMKLLCNVYEPNEGEILINGKNLQNIDTQTWYDNIGILSQEYNTYSHLTVKENIILGNPNIKFNSKRMIEAANNADALTFINEFPHKFEQILGNTFTNGIRPSTGQWQKIAIARFFYRDAPLVIFDEPTAAIDAVSEYNIFNKIYRFFKKKTVIIISHRFSTVRNADRIIVLDNGKIIENGTHEELIKKGGKYAHSFNLQAQGYTS